MSQQNLSAERLRSLLHYDTKTGVFTRRVGVRGAHAGVVAGTFHKASGYIIVGVDRIRYRAHRLAWLYMTGEWPAEIDHRNTERTDNRWANLREASRSQNNANMKIRSDNLSGFKGVSWDKANARWRAALGLNGRQKHLGRFDSRDEAVAAYRAAAREYFGEFARA